MWAGVRAAGQLPGSADQPSSVVIAARSGAASQYAFQPAIATLVNASAPAKILMPRCDRRGAACCRNVSARRRESGTGGRKRAGGSARSSSERPISSKTPEAAFPRMTCGRSKPRAERQRPHLSGGTGARGSARGQGSLEGWGGSPFRELDVISWLLCGWHCCWLWSAAPVAATRGPRSRPRPIRPRPIPPRPISLLRSRRRDRPPATSATPTTWAPRSAASATPTNMRAGEPASTGR